MKNIIHLSVLTALAINLTACYKQSDILGGEEYLKDNKNGLVSDCRGEFLSTKFKPSEADVFWKDNNLPRGTTQFVCKNGTAYLPKQATDCQGSLLYKREGGIQGFLQEYKLNATARNIRFACQNGQVVHVP